MQAPIYVRATDFSNDEATNVGGRSTVRTSQLDAELDALGLTANALRSNQELNQRDDGEIRDERVKLFTLAPEVKALLVASGGTIRGAWLTATVYSIKDVVSNGINTYICATPHTSGVFATDLAANKWVMLASGETASTLVSTLIADLADTSDPAKGPSMIGWLRAMTGAVATTLKNLLGWQEVSLFEFLTVAQIADYHAGTLTLDLTAEVQAWLTAAAGQVAVLPRGFAKVTSPPTVPAGTTVRGRGSASRIYGYGCDGLIVGGDYVNLENFAVYSRSAVGVADPKLYKGIYASGTSGTHINYLNVTNVLCRGWSTAAYLAYTWSTCIDDLQTINSSYGVLWFGQSVNNVVTKCQLVCDLACIITLKDGATRGEGLMISDSLLSSASSGVYSDGFLALGVYDCVVDLIGGSCFDFTGVESFTIDCPWAYSVNRVVNLAALGSPTDIGGSIRIGRATTTSADSLIVIGANNKGCNVFGSQLKKAAGGGYPILINGAETAVFGNNIENLASTSDIYVNAADCAVFGNTGDKDVEWNVSQVLTVASAAGAMTLLPSQSNSFIISGNLTITSIPVAGWDGKMVTLVSTGGTWTLTDGSNLKLAGNFVSTGDDSITLACVGANWYEVSRSAN